jgi:hypothetical protein
LAAAAFGLLGIGKKTRDDSGKLTRNGKIALTGIVLAGALAVSTSVYDFVAAQARAEQERAKSERLFRSVQEGLYPFKDVGGSIKIRFTRRWPALFQYRQRIRAAGLSPDKPCHPTDANSCTDTDSGPEYYIGTNSRLYPDPHSPFLTDLNNIRVTLSLVKATNQLTAVDYKKLGFIVYHISTIHSPGFISYNPRSDEFSYTAENFTISPVELMGVEAYSLADIFPGYISANARLIGQYCPTTDEYRKRDCDSSTFFADQGMQVQSAELTFKYPKSIRIEASPETFCKTRYGLPVTFIRLPDDIERLGSFGDIAGDPKPAEIKSVVCPRPDKQP